MRANWASACCSPEEGSWACEGSAEGTPIDSAGFYDLLEERAAAAEDEDSDNEEEVVWERDMPLDEASEALLRPHNPQFYPEHRSRAETFLSPLAGQSEATLTCTLSQLEDEIPSLTLRESPRSSRLSFLRPWRSQAPSTRATRTRRRRRTSIPSRFRRASSTWRDPPRAAL
ncbi:hypothetical protein [Nesterenkonia pannonica]|uniref:hypothetical protein n=1 Tax=Nesterenkonia pannonica TaxID=1548602 RepID=UPI002164E05A|nr:hypothetical protein [Nesterenkonia pannonica]